MLYVQDEDGTYLPATKQAIFSAAKRLSSYRFRKGAVIQTSEDAKDAILHKLVGYHCEMFACLFLDSQHRVLEFQEMFRGTINTATVHPREVVKAAVQVNAAAVIFAHNHPSGITDPSAQDIELSTRLKEILKVIDVRVLDHLVVGETVLSMADAGYLK